MGDLVATCSSAPATDLRKNLGRGMPLADIASTNRVVEGVTSSKSVMELARAQSVEMPITGDRREGRRGAGEAEVMLASRTAKPERYG